MPTPKKPAKAAKPARQAAARTQKPKPQPEQKPQPATPPKRARAPRTGSPAIRAGVLRQPLDWVPAYLESLQKCGIKARAAKAARISLRSVIDHRHINQEFAAAEEAAMKVVNDLAISEAVRRATEGTVKPVFGSLGAGAGTGVVGHITEYDNALLLRILEWRETGSFRQRQQIETGAPGAFDTAADRKAALEAARAAKAATGG